MAARLITGVLLAAGVIALVGWGPLWGIFLLVQAASVVALVEWYRFRGAEQGWRDVAVALGLSALLPVLGYLAPEYLSEALGLAVVLVLTDGVLRPEPIAGAWQRMCFALTGLIYPGLPLALLAFLATGYGEASRYILLLLFAGVWMGDTGAYFAGRALGRHKLHPKVSPKKTWEGAVGGLAGSIAGVFAIRAIFPFVHDLSALDALAIGAGCAIFEQVGDLAESLFKRSFGVKDSGAILPGHGGMLDRIDGLLFAAPFMLGYLQLRPGLL